MRPATRDSAVTARNLARRLVWPGLLAVALFLTWLGMRTEHGFLWFNLVYLAFAAAIGVLERAMPYDAEWLVDDRQTLVDLAHTLLNKGLVQICAVFTASIGLATAVQPEAGLGEGPWPGNWPMVYQIVLGLLVAEFGMYWAHRIGHMPPFFWRFHAVHHSVTRLWFVNTGRFHPVDTMLSILLSQPLLYLLGAPVEVFLWVAAVTAFIGMLTHCNIETQTGFFDRFFNTPTLHRWHHSMVLSEGNTNYGENLMIWDRIFGTYFNPDRRPPRDIGIRSHMPRNFVGQLVQPFRRGALEEPLESGTHL